MNYRKSTAGRGVLGFIALILIAACGCVSGSGPAGTPLVSAAPVPSSAGAQPDFVDAGATPTGLPVLVETPTPEAPTPLPSPGATPTAGSQFPTIAVAAPTPPSVPTASRTQRDVSGFGLFSLFGGGAAAYGGDFTVPSVEDVVEKGLYGMGTTPVHIAFRGTAASGSVRCGWRGVARTPEQREGEIRFWLGIGEDEDLPSAGEVEEEFLYHISGMTPIYRDAQKARFLPLARGGLSPEYVYLACYADYAVSEYLLGAGPASPNRVIVAYDGLGEERSYDLFRRSQAAGEFGDDSILLVTEAEHTEWLDVWAEYVEVSLREMVEGREGVVFLAPMGAYGTIAIEAWQAVAQWDVQTGDDSVVNAVRFGAGTDDPEWTQTLANLKSRVAAAVASPTPSPAGGGASGQSDEASPTPTPAPAPTRIASVGGLSGYYRSIGAYGFIGPYSTGSDTSASGASGSSATSTEPSTPEPNFTPAQPPPVFAPKPASLSATASGEDTANLAWGAVSAASGYRVQHRIRAGEDEGWSSSPEGPDQGWSAAAGSVTGTSHSVTGLWCGKTHEFRVAAYGDGATYNERAGLWSATASSTMSACTAHAPRFRAGSYSFEVNAVAPTGAAAGAVSAYDVNGDTVTYSIASGNGAGKFSIESDTGAVTVAGSLSAAAGTTYTLTVNAADGVSGSTGVTVKVLVREPTCNSGVAVEKPRSNFWLVSDCMILLAAKDTLRGAAELNWSAYTPIASWEGVGVSGTPKRVTRIDLSRAGLSPARNPMAGSIPPEFGSLGRLTRLDLTRNSLTGGIPSELGNLRNLAYLSVRSNSLSGGVPPELGMLVNLTGLVLDRNSLTGEIPPELGSLTKLTELRVSNNSLTGCAPAGWRDVSTKELQAGMGYCGPAPGSPTIILGSSIRVVPDAVSGATSYEAELSGGGSSRRTTCTDTEGCTFSGETGRSYTARVRHTDSGGLSAWSSRRAFTYHGGMASDSVSFTRVAGSVTVSWTPAPGDVVSQKAVLTYTASGCAFADISRDGPSRSFADGTTGSHTFNADLSSYTCVFPQVINYYSSDLGVYAYDYGPVIWLTSGMGGRSGRIGFGFDFEYSYPIDEDAATSTVLVIMEASGPVVGPAESYSIISGNREGKFEVGRYTGEVRVAGRLNYDITRSYTLSIEAGDGLGGTATSTVYVLVRDVYESIEGLEPAASSTVPVIPKEEPEVEASGGLAATSTDPVIPEDEEEEESDGQGETGTSTDPVIPEDEEEESDGQGETGTSTDPVIPEDEEEESDGQGETGTSTDPVIPEDEEEESDGQGETGTSTDPVMPEDEEEESDGQGETGTSTVYMLPGDVYEGSGGPGGRGAWVALTRAAPEGWVVTEYERYRRKSGGLVRLVTLEVVDGSATEYVGAISIEPTSGFSRSAATV